MWHWNFISTWHMFFFSFLFVSNVFKFKFLVTHSVLLLALFFVKNNAKNDVWTASEIVTIATILQHTRVSAIPKYTCKLPHFISYKGTGESSPCHRASLLIDLINAGVTGSCDFQQEIKYEKHSSEVCLSKSCVIFPYMVKVETSILLVKKEKNCLWSNLRSNHWHW